MQKKNIIFQRRKNGEGKGGKYLENEIYFSWKLKLGEGKGGKYLEMKDIFFVEVKKTEKKRRIIYNRAVHPLINCKRPFHADDHLQAASQSG